jgi:hypothetical protein
MHVENICTPLEHFTKIAELSWHRPVQEALVGKTNASIRFIFETGNLFPQHLFCDL